MGTNYYLRFTDNSEKVYHIGKLSVGWRFAMQAYPADGIRIFNDYVTLIANNSKTAYIVDEYGRVTNLHKLSREIMKRGEMQQHSDSKHQPLYDVIEGDFS